MTCVHVAGSSAFRSGGLAKGTMGFVQRMSGRFLTALLVVATISGCEGGDPNPDSETLRIARSALDAMECLSFNLVARKTYGPSARAHAENRYPGLATLLNKAGTP